MVGSQGPEKEHTFKPQDWATSVYEEEKNIRDHAAAAHLDASRLVRGFALSIITGDDKNIFGWINHLPFRVGRGRRAGKELQTRLNWEINIPELPEDIRMNLSQEQEKIKALDLGKGPGFVAAFSLWEETRKLIENQVDSSAELKADVEYYVYNKRNLDILKTTQAPE